MAICILKTLMSDTGLLYIDYDHVLTCYKRREITNYQMEIKDGYMTSFKEKMVSPKFDVQVTLIYSCFVWLERKAELHSWLLQGISWHDVADIILLVIDF